MDNNEHLKKDMEQMGKTAESMMKHVQSMVNKTFKDISPEQAKLFAQQLNDAGMDEKIKDVKKQAEELKKQFNKHVS